MRDATCAALMMEDVWTYEPVKGMLTAASDCCCGSLLGSVGLVGLGFCLD